MALSHHPTRAHVSRQGRPDPAAASKARKVLDALLREAKIEQKTGDQIWDEMVRRHHRDIPVQVVWQRRAARLQGEA
jgi:hypothetical protein